MINPGVGLETSLINEMIRNGLLSRSKAKPQEWLIGVVFIVS